MASYSQPSEKYNGVYNPDYFVGKEDEQKLSAVGNAVEVVGDYVKRDGSNVMTGSLTTPSIILFNAGAIHFDDTTSQNSAFTSEMKTDLISNTQTLTNLSYSNDTTTITGAVRIKKFVFIDDDNNEQVAAFTSSIANDIVALKQKTTAMTYDSGNLKTTIDILHANTFTTGSFNSSHLSGTLSNVQTQLTTLSSDVTPLKTNCQQISYDSQTLTTTIPDNTELENVFCDKITFGYHEQTDAYTSLEKTKLSWLNIDATELLINQIKYLDNSVQTTAFTTDKDTILRAVDDKTNHITASQTGQPSTVITGNTATNFLTLYDGYSELGKITFPDLTQQTTAYSTEERSKTQHQSATILPGNNKLTLFDGTVQADKFEATTLNIDNTVFADLTTQSTAFTSTLRTNLEDLKYNCRNVIYYDDGFNTTQIGGQIVTNYLRLYDGNIIFADATTQSTAFTNDKNTMLNTVNGKTSYISSFQITDAPPTTVLTGHCDTNFLTLYDGFNSQGKLTFPDGSFQTTAFTNDLKIKVNAMHVVGVIQVYAGVAADPSGWFICDGRMLSQAEYPALFAVIGQMYVGNKAINQDLFFCIPDMRNLYIRGNAPSNNNTYSLPNTQFSSSIGQFKPMQVQAHKHAYSDRGEGTVNVTKIASAGGSITGVANDTQQNFYTSSETYNESFIQESNLETMPNSICMNYIIKY